MSWYSSPVQPMDPVVVSQQPKPPFRYFRDNFTGSGQHSYIKAPAQDQAQWQALTNVMPITQGILNQRWGYISFAGLLFQQNRLSNFQSDSIGTRAIIAAGLNGVTAYREDGSLYNTNIYNPIASGGVVRSITSRNFQYFCDGVNALQTPSHLTGDSVKWDGSASGGVSNIGILVSDVTKNSSTTTGPNTGTSVSDQTTPGYTANPWTSQSGVFSNSLGTAAACTSFVGIPGHNFTDLLTPVGFFSAVPGNTVKGIQLTIQYTATPGGGLTNASLFCQVQLVKNGTPYAPTKASSLNTANGSLKTLTFGGPTDLWGGAFSVNDLQQANFGFQFGMTGNGSSSGAGSTLAIKVPYVTMTVFTQDTTGNSVTTTSTVGGGAVSLVLGRLYYMVGNNSTTGHFSDLNDPSVTTGPVTTSSFNLSLPKYNDPQVDTKYLLATPDGGDPSTLYEVQVLAPGLTVTSWSLVTNVVTFTGTYTGARPGNGTTIIVGGLAHGSYMNGQQITVTSTSPTTLVAGFTHGNDSATEIGIVGNLTFAIPNNVTNVVDNTPDTTLVLAQPLLFTDNTGTEFGVSLNTPPPAGTLLVKHQGRLWMAGVAGATHSVFFSKSVAELTLPNGFIAGKYEEAWPGVNYFDVSDGAESVQGLLSDGQTLYIGTQNHIRRLIGNNPFNFQEPQIVHPTVGLMNQEVWQLIFAQGTPSGSLWMTPDFKVIQSDFNTYVDVGGPIQDILNALQPTAANLAHAQFVSDGEFDLYILAVPYRQSTYCDTHLVFDLRTRQWFVWTPDRGSLSILFNVTAAGAPQWLFINGILPNISKYDQLATTDNGIPISVVATTTFLHMGEPTRRKVLNEIQIYGNTGMTMDVYGSNNLTSFDAPRPICYNRVLRQSPLGTWNLYLTGDKSRYRYYQFTFKSSNGQIPLLGSYGISAAALDDL